MLGVVVMGRGGGGGGCSGWCVGGGSSWCVGGGSVGRSGYGVRECGVFIINILTLIFNINIKIHKYNYFNIYKY